MVYSGAWGKLILKKPEGEKSRCTVPLIQYRRLGTLIKYRKTWPTSRKATIQLGNDIGFVLLVKIVGSLSGIFSPDRDDF